MNQASYFRPMPGRAVDLRHNGEPWERRAEFGAGLRQATPLASHAGWAPPKNRPSPLATLSALDEGRQTHLIALRAGRMAATPLSFLRGAAAVMAWDLAHTPVSGLSVTLCGDAHLGNFGLYGAPDGEVVFDINDFDEATIGPWEWDVKRLTASVNVLGRELGLGAKARRVAATLCAAGYRLNMRRLRSIGVLDLWTLQTAADRVDGPMLAQLHPAGVALSAAAQRAFSAVVAKARRSGNATAIKKMAVRADGGWRFKHDPPLLTPIDAPLREKLIDALDAYAGSVAPERRFMLERYRVADVAHRVVGVGSVGLRAYLALLIGDDDADLLVLQVKEAVTPAHAPYVPSLPPEWAHDGRRVAQAAKIMQAAHDPLLGFTEMDGRHYYVRQMKNMKASIPTADLTGDAMNFFAFGIGALLARAHARGGDAAAIAGYCGETSALDEALADWAEAYGEQTMTDHASLAATLAPERA